MVEIFQEGAESLGTTFLGGFSQGGKAGGDGGESAQAAVRVVGRSYAREFPHFRIEHDPRHGIANSPPLVPEGLEVAAGHIVCVIERSRLQKAGKAEQQGFS